MDHARLQHSLDKAKESTANMGQTQKSMAKGATLAALMFSASTAYAAEFTFTELQLHYGDGYVLGRNGVNETARTTATLEHLSVGQVGEFYFFVDSWYDHDGPSVGVTESDQYGEVYGFLSGKNIGLTFDENSFIRDVGLEAGLNQGTDLSIGLLGARANLNMPGFSAFTVGVYAYDNWNDPFDRDLDTTYQATIVWAAPFEIGSQKFSAQGFVDFIGSQGSGVANQVIFSPQLRWDIGHAMGGKEGRFNLGLEYTHWENKFGVSNVNEDAISVFAAIKF